LKANPEKEAILYLLYHYIKDDLMSSKILVIEDSKNISLLIEKCLERNGFQVFLAEDGLKAMEKVFEIMPDLILLDILIPKLNGLLVCEALKSNSEVSKIPIIAISAKTQYEDIQKAMKAGAEDYLTKPFTPDELIMSVRKYI
jgi:DNA-binding response OmpR family regulator